MEPWLRPHAQPVFQKKPVSDPLPFSPMRPKKTGRRDRLRPPQRRPCRPPGPFTVNKADIQQYDFHSSGEEDSPPPPSPLVSSTTEQYHTQYHRTRVLTVFWSPQCPSSSSDEEQNNPDGVYVFRRKAGCEYLSVSSSAVLGTDGSTSTTASTLL